MYSAGKHGIGPWHLRHHGLDPFLPSLSRLTGGIKGATNNVNLRALSFGDLSGDVRYSMSLTESPQ